MGDHKISEFNIYIYIYIAAGIHQKHKLIIESLFFYHLMLSILVLKFLSESFPLKLSELVVQIIYYYILWNRLVY